jgi:hypothetical protein
LAIGIEFSKGDDRVNTRNYAAKCLLRCGLAGLILAMFTVSGAYAQPLVEVAKLVAGDAAVDNCFGYSVSQAGNRVLIGAYRNHDGGYASGAAYVFEYDGNEWSEVAKLKASDAAPDDWFGRSVSLSGDRALIGAHGNDDAGERSGSTYVFEYDGNEWSEVAKLTASDAAAYDVFGYSVSLSGDRALIGAFENDDAGDRTGSAYVFEYDGNEWSEAAKLIASDATANDAFGWSVSLSGPRALVGAHQGTVGGYWVGSAYVFEYDGNEWSEAAKLTASDAASSDLFGCSVSLSGDRALIGAVYNDDAGENSGSAYVFAYDGNGWSEMAKLTASDAAEGDRFGESVSLSGDRALVGAYFDGDAGDRSGSAYMFEYDGNGWSEVVKLTASDAAEGDNFGKSVSLSDDRALIGASNDDDAGVNSGSAYVFDPPTEATLSLPDLQATYKQAITVPLSLDRANDLVSAEAFIEYDTYLLTLMGVTPTGTLTDGWSIETKAEPGSGTFETLKIATAADQSSATGQVTLLNLEFTVNDVRSPASSSVIFTHALLNDGTPGNITVNGSVTLVGVDGTIVHDLTQIIPREDIAVTVTDVDEDRDILVKDSFDVQVSNGSQTETLSVLESDVSSGIFEGTISTVFSLGATSDDDILQAMSGDVIQSCYDDWLDAAGNTVERCVSTNVIGGRDGAIRITIVSQPGDTVRVRVTDADLNVNPGAQENAQVTATNPTTGESETIDLDEDGDNSDVFFGLLFTAPGSAAGAPDDATLNTAKGDVLDVSYLDVVTAPGGTEDLTDDDEVVDPFGDADGNGSVQAFDAAKVLLHALTPYLTGLDSLSANLDLLAFDPVHGKITHFDASLVLQKRVGKIGRFPVQEDEADNHPQPETDDSTPKSILDERLLSLQTHDGYVSVWADDRSQIVSGELVVKGVSGAVEMGEGLDDFLSASREIEEGLRIVFAGASPVDGPGELVRIYGMGSDGFQLTWAHFNDGGIVGRMDGIERGRVVPASFVLYPNVPNPFNPETMIRFELPYRTSVCLEVFDVLGQRVLVLVAEELSMGGHQVVWDGRDANGAPVSNGLYLYRLQAGDFEQVRRMLLLK